MIGNVSMMHRRDSQTLMNDDYHWHRNRQERSGDVAMKAKPTHSHSASQGAHDACREQCSACALACTTALYRHCLTAGGEHAKPDHVRMMVDCAEICQTSANFLARGSDLHSAICAACAEVCLACADQCRDLEGMEECVSACEKCEQSCRAMADQET